MATDREQGPDDVLERHVLVAADGSENAQRAVVWIGDFFGGLPGCRVTLLHIVLEPAAGHFAGDDERRVWEEEHRKAAREVLDRYRRILVSAGIPAEKIDLLIDVVEVPSVADAILRQQERLHPCAIAVGRRALSKKEEFLFGSTSSKILHEAKNCAVMVVE